jgi:hypothetical protein
MPIGQRKNDVYVGNDAAVGKDADIGKDDADVGKDADIGKDDTDVGEKVLTVSENVTSPAGENITAERGTNTTGSKTDPEVRTSREEVAKPRIYLLFITLSSLFSDPGKAHVLKRKAVLPASKQWRRAFILPVLMSCWIMVFIGLDFFLDA